jgi:hypothetical protein
MCGLTCIELAEEARLKQLSLHWTRGDSMSHHPQAGEAHHRAPTEGRLGRGDARAGPMPGLAETLRPSRDYGGEMM